MVRPTSEQIDREIVDAAARTFATLGYARTSVQQLADAVGYSKTGLLHRFRSKVALYDAAIAETSTAVQAIIVAARGHTAGPERTLAVLHGVTATALNHPGLVLMLVEALRPSSTEPARDQLHALVLGLVEMLGGDITTPEQRLRIRLALKLMVDAVIAQSDADLQLAPSDLHSLIIELALPVLGAAAHLPVTTHTQEAS